MASSGSFNTSAYQGRCLTFSWSVASQDSGSGSWSLPQIPRQANITNAPNFNDTQNPTITYSNPAGNNVSSLQACISLTGANDDIAYRNISKTGTSYTFNLTEAERNVLRQATTTSNTRNVIFYIRTIIGGNTFYSTVTKTLTIVNANPTIGTIAYEDTNSTTTGITDNNQIIIQNNSTLQFNFSTLTALKYATLSSVAVTINGVTKSTSLSGTSISSQSLNFGIVNAAYTLNASIVVTDSRGNKSTYTKEITIESWSLPTAIITCNRQNNYYSETDINVNADYSSLDSKNQLTIQYQYKKTTDSSYSALQILQDNVTTTFIIDNEYAWNIKVIVSDLLGSTIYNLFVDKGIPIVYFDRLNNSTGFNCFPQNQGSTEIDGDLFINNKNLLDMIVGIGGLCKSAPTSDWNTACGSINGIYMGADMSNSPSGDTVANWWIVLHMAHNDLYQRQVAFSFLNNNGIYTRLKNNGTWGSWTQV